MKVSGQILEFSAFLLNCWLTNTSVKIVDTTQTPINSTESIWTTKVMFQNMKLKLPLDQKQYQNILNFFLLLFWQFWRSYSLCRHSTNKFLSDQNICQSLLTWNSLGCEWTKIPPGCLSWIPLLAANSCPITGGPASWDNAASRWETFMRPLRQPFTFPGNCRLARAECIHTILLPTPLPKENMRQDFQELPEQHIPIEEINWWKRRICEEKMRGWDDIAGICRGLLIRSGLDRVKCRRKSRKNRCRRKKEGRQYITTPGETMNSVDNGDDNERTILYLEKSEFMIVFYKKGAGKNKKM